MAKSQLVASLLGHALWEWSSRKDDAIKHWAEKLLRFFGQRCPAALLGLPWKEGIARGRNWFVRRKQIALLDEVLLKHPRLFRVQMPATKEAIQSGGRGLLLGFLGLTASLIAKAGEEASRQQPAVEGGSIGKKQSGKAGGGGGGGAAQFQKESLRRLGAALRVLQRTQLPGSEAGVVPDSEAALRMRGELAALDRVALLKPAADGAAGTVCQQVRKAVVAVRSIFPPNLKKGAAYQQCLEVERAIERLTALPAATGSPGLGPIQPSEKSRKAAAGSPHVGPTQSASAEKLRKVGSPNLGATPTPTTAEQLKKRRREEAKTEVVQEEEDEPEEEPSEGSPMPKRLKKSGSARKVR